MARKRREKPGRTKRPRQGHFEVDGESMAPPCVPEIDQAAEVYRAVRDERMRLTKVEVEKSEALLALMEKHKLTAYSFDALDVKVTETKKVKVRRKKWEAEDEDE